MTVLITVLSVMNGFDDQIRKRFFALIPQLTVYTSLDQSASSLADIKSKIKGIKAVKAPATKPIGLAFIVVFKALKDTLAAFMPLVNKVVTILAATVAAL